MTGSLALSFQIVSGLATGTGKPLPLHTWSVIMPSKTDASSYHDLDKIKRNFKLVEILWFIGLGYTCMIYIREKDIFSL